MSDHLNSRGFSQLLDRMHDVMAGYVERGEVPGIVTLISRRGAVRLIFPFARRSCTPRTLRLLY